jgi:alkylhydroperoxidase/carboxymuconolactone decarboxylase family protein YurZ
MSDKEMLKAIDRLLIRETIDSYGTLYDAGRLEEFGNLFAEDAQLSFEPDPGFFKLPLVGRNEIREKMGQRYAEVSLTAQRRHVTTNTIFKTLDHSEAATESFGTILSVDFGGEPELRATGVYHDTFSKVAGQWKFKTRHLLIDGIKSDEDSGSNLDQSSAVQMSALEKEIVDEIGSALPDAISQYTELDPEMFRAYREYRTVLLDQGVIPRKDKLLMVLALLTVLHQGDAMHMYAEIARNEGATAEEIRDAMRVGILFSGGPGIVAASGAVVKFGQDLDPENS